MLINVGDTVKIKETCIKGKVLKIVLGSYIIQQNREFHGGWIPVVHMKRFSDILKISDDGKE